jgi:hypothetical protein
MHSLLMVHFGGMARSMGLSTRRTRVRTSVTLGDVGYLVHGSHESYQVDLMASPQPYASTAPLRLRALADGGQVQSSNGSAPAKIQRC